MRAGPFCGQGESRWAEGRLPAQRSVLRNVLQGLQGGTLGDESPSGGDTDKEGEDGEVMRHFRKKTIIYQPQHLCSLSNDCNEA